MSINHNNLTYDDVTTSYKLWDAELKRYIYVEWSVVRISAGGNPKAPKKYSVEISNLGRNFRKYSLLTLGFQRIDWKTKITKIVVTGGGNKSVEITDDNDVTKPRTLDKVDKQYDGGEGRDMPLEANVWFAQFTDVNSATFYVEEVDQPQCGYPIWKGGPGGDGHDTVPPKNPPD